MTTPQPPAPNGPGPTANAGEDRSKDRFFVGLAELAEAMIAAHGKDFAMGALILSARFIAEGKPLVKRDPLPGATSGEDLAAWAEGARRQ